MRACAHVCLYLERSHAELNTEAQVNTEEVGQKIEEHVVSTKQRDEEEGGLSKASAAQKDRNKQQEMNLPQGLIWCISCMNAAPESIMHEDVLIIAWSRGACVCGKVVSGAWFNVMILRYEHTGNAFYVWWSILI